MKTLTSRNKPILIILLGLGAALTLTGCHTWHVDSLSVGIHGGHYGHGHGHYRYRGHGHAHGHYRHRHHRRHHHY